MAGVTQINRPKGPAQSILPVAGAAVGTAFGGPAGGVVGSAIGSRLAQSGPDPQNVQSKAAIQRRLDSYGPQGGEDPAAQIAEAQAAVQHLPPDLQKQYAPALAEAQRRAAMGGNV